MISNSMTRHSILSSKKKTIIHYPHTNLIRPFILHAHHMPSRLSSPTQPSPFPIHQTPPPPRTSSPFNRPSRTSPLDLQFLHPASTPADGNTSSIRGAALPLPPLRLRKRKHSHCNRCRHLSGQGHVRDTPRFAWVTPHPPRR